jgi:tetratricopeptide (TPR) repeat protein
MNRKQRRAAAKQSRVQTSPHTGAAPAVIPGLDDLFAAGLQHHQAGRLAEAERHYRQILAVDDRHADSLHLLGVIARQAGQNEAAAELIGLAIGLRNDVPAYHNNLGNALRDQGRLDEAVASFRHALSLAPDFPEAHNNLGNALRDLGKLDEAMASYRRALSLRPDYAEAHNNMGTAFRDKGKLDEAIASYQRALALKPGYAEAHNNLGIAFGEHGKLDDAVVCYQRALTLKPDFAKVYNNLGNALRDLGKLDDAVASYRGALTRKPDYAEAHNNLGIALGDLGKPDEAMASYQHALALKPDFAEAHNNLGNALRDLGKLDEAMACYQRALTLKPDYAEAHNNMGIALRNLGKLDEARRASEKAIELAPGIARYYFNSIAVKRVVAGDRYLAALEELTHGKSMPAKEQTNLHFVLAKAYSDLNEQERAVRHLIEGNALKRRETIYDEAVQLRIFDRIRDVFTPELMRDKQGLGDTSAVPIFIVGMPRSGSTLVEQILASHPKVFGAGELMDFTRLVAGLNGRDGAGPSYPEVVPALSGEALRQLGADYREGISRAAPAAERITDKMPSNFCFAGLIHLALPNARIIHTRRDPLDTCFSCFFNLFGGDQPYAYDLRELGRYYRAYEILMEHWRRVLPKGTMLEVQYEDVVADLEEQARRLISYCGLEWDNACLDFHQTQRPVWTASATQVRQPIYKSSVGRWRPYKKLLQPLIDALGPREEPPGSGD